MKVLQISKRGLPTEVMELGDFRARCAESRRAAGDGGICADHINLWRMVMRAIEAKTFSGYGGLRQTELPKPQPAKDEVLIHVTAAGVTPLDHTILSGGPPRAKAPLVLGLWGTSYAGGHALILGATDRRIACVVSQVPTISGYQQGLRRVAPEGIAALEAALNDDERAQARGEPPRRQAIVSADSAIPAAHRAKDAIDFYLQPLGAGARWENTVTMRSTRLARMYEPGAWVPRISPTPLLMIVGSRDIITLTVSRCLFPADTST